uniref:Uncharacterized protein n=1 Tax=Aegilops tauschii TaxID=37682 RepID=M8BV93_AEGTA
MGDVDLHDFIGLGAGIYGRSSGRGHALRIEPNFGYMATASSVLLIVVLALVGCAAARRAKAATCRGGSAPSSYSWCITGFSLAALNNALLVGVPLLDAMYGKWAGDIIVQLSVLQVVVWFPLMLIVFEARQAWLEVTSEPADADQGAREEGDLSAPAEGAREDGSQAALGSDFEWPARGENGRKTAATGCAFWAPLLRAVGVKLARNPNVYASLLGVAWSSVANSPEFQLPAFSLFIKEAPREAAEVGTTHLGAPGPPSVPWWVVLPSELSSVPDVITDMRRSSGMVRRVV